MKKHRFAAIVAAMLALVMALVVGCADDGSGQGGTPTNKTPRIELRSDPQQDMLVGARFTLMYSVRNSDSGVVCSSDDEDVVQVDKFATVTAVGAGTATVTIALEDDRTKYVEVHFTVKRNNFMTDRGLYNGNIKFGEQATGGPVSIDGGQTQLLANARGQKWYFKTHIDHKGFIGGDSGGMWGVGSFLVDAGHAIGNNMFWFIMQRAESNDTVRVKYGGWRYAYSVPADKVTLINDNVYSVKNGVEFTIIRDGIKHYMIAEFTDGETVTTVKYMYDLPFFDESDTYPGVFSQNQNLTVKNYSMSNDPAAVDRELAKFQLAEAVEINGPSDTVYAGEYMLTSTVTPTYTIDKAVTYTLNTPVEGIALAADGTLTVSQSAVGSSFTVIATAKSDTAVSTEKTYTVAEKAQSTSTVFDSAAVITIKAADGTAARSVNIESDAAVTVTDRSTEGESGDAYIPLVHSSSKWYLTAAVKNRTAQSGIRGTEIGVMSATNGLMDYYKLGIKYDQRVSDVEFSRMNGEATVFEQGAVSTNNAVNTLGLIRDGSVYYVELNGKFVKKITADEMGDTNPMLYTLGSGAYFTDVTLQTDGDAIDEYIASKRFYVGSLVTVSGNSYTLKAVDLGEAGNDKDTLDWPPDNDYANGIKSAQSFTGEYEISFRVSDVQPLNLSGIYDAKILIYLKSERVTSSLQFVIKRDSADMPVTVQFTSNLDDATWTAYDLPSSVDLLGGESTVRVVHRSNCVELYINGARIFEGETFMDNTGYWSDSTVSTPGIGSFMCGMTITDPVFTEVSEE